MKEKEILQRVFPSQLQHLLFLLNSQNQPIRKGQSYYEKSLVKASQSPNATPCNLQRLADVLMKSLILPSLDEENGLLIKTPILLALSPYLRQNLILFLRRFKSHFVYDEFADFLCLNRSKLDSWSKVILRSEEEEEEDIKQTECSSRKKLIISKSSISKLASLKSKFSSFSYHLDDVSGTETETETESENEECLITSPPSKRRRLPSPPDNFFGEDDIDEEEMVLACDMSVAEFNKSKESSQIRSSAPDESLDECSKGNECSSEFFVNNRSVIESCKTDLNPDKLSDIISLFTSCPLLDFQNLLTVEFNTVQWNDEFVLLLFERFIREDCLSFEKLKSFVYTSITQRLRQCQDVVPRGLMEIISSLIKLSSRVGIVGVVCEVLLFEEFRPVHHELITKLFASEILSNSDVNKILEDSLARAMPESWNEHLFGTLDFLVCKKASLTDNTFALLISNLAVAAKKFEKSLKLIKLVISLIQNYDNQKIRFANTLKSIVDLNKTFLKKKAIALL